MSKKIVLGVAAILVVVAIAVVVVTAVMISRDGATTNSGNLTKEVKDDSSTAASISKGEDSTTQDDYKESTTKSSTPHLGRLPPGNLSQAESGSTTQPTQQPDSTLPANDEAPPFEEQPSQTTPSSMTPEVFMQLDNNCKCKYCGACTTYEIGNAIITFINCLYIADHGGVVLKIQDQIQKVSL